MFTAIVSTDSKTRREVAQRCDREGVRYFTDKEAQALVIKMSAGWLSQWHARLSNALVSMHQRGDVRIENYDPDGYGIVEV